MEVGGAIVDRIQHGIFVTRVPLALVPPGKRKISFKKDISDTGEDVQGPFDFHLEEGKHYRVVENEGVIEIVESK